MKKIKVNGKEIKTISNDEHYVMFLSNSEEKIEANEIKEPQLITINSKETFINNLTINEPLVVEGELIIT